MVSVPLEQVADKRKPVSKDVYRTAEVFFG
jgi:hypothetical protein